MSLSLFCVIYLNDEIRNHNLDSVYQVKKIFGT